MRGPPTQHPSINLTGHKACSKKNQKSGGTPRKSWNSLCLQVAAQSFLMRRRVYCNQIINRRRLLRKGQRRSEYWWSRSWMISMGYSKRYLRRPWSRFHNSQSKLLKLEYRIRHWDRIRLKLRSRCLIRYRCPWQRWSKRKLTKTLNMSQANKQAYQFIISKNQGIVTTLTKLVQDNNMHNL